MYQATGKASSSVQAVARIDITAVRTKVCQYSGSSTKVAVLLEAELVDARRDARAQRQHGELDVRQHDQADAATAAPARAAAAAPAARAARPAVGGDRWSRRRRRGKQTARCGSKPNAIVSPTREIGEAPGLRQRDPDLGAGRRSRARSTAELAPSNSRLATSSGEALRGRPAARRRRARASTTSGRTKASTASPGRDRAAGARANSEPPGVGHQLDEVAVDARGLAGEAVVGADEAGDERRRAAR